MRKTGLTGFILTASRFGSAIGVNPFQSREQLAVEMKTGKQTPPPSEKSLLNMAHGVEHEDEARKIYESISGSQVVTVGMAISKHDVRLGCSPDGLVGEDGMIEIKCPHSMYSRLACFSFPVSNHSSKRLQFQKVTVSEKSEHWRCIFESHYAQMQGSMYVTGRTWCDYVVYDVSSSQMVVLKVMFDEGYWYNFAYPALLSFMKEVEAPEID